MPVLLSALSALVLGHLFAALFFNGAHKNVVRGLVKLSHPTGLGDDLVQFEFDNAFSSGSLQLRDNFPHDSFFENRLHRMPVGF